MKCSVLFPLVAVACDSVLVLIIQICNISSPFSFLVLKGELQKAMPHFFCKLPSCYHWRPCHWTKTWVAAAFYLFTIRLLKMACGIWFDIATICIRVLETWIEACTGLRIGTWNTSCILVFARNRSLYATSPTLSWIYNGPKYLACLNASMSTSRVEVSHKPNRQFEIVPLSLFCQLTLSFVS